MNTALPSMDDVARHAGVSAATVSRVLTGSKPVSASTRQRVEASIAQLGYKTNAFGRSLSKGVSHLILVLVPDFSNPYYAEIISGAATLARQHGYTLLPIDLEESGQVEQQALEEVYGSLTDGVINMMPMNPERERRLAPGAEHKPWVNCSEFLEHSALPYVSIDHRQAACDAVQYLINRGHQRIALINSNERFLYARQRREGYEMALRGAGIPIDTSMMLETGSTRYESGAQAAAHLLTLKNPPTAVFAVSDTLAIGAIKTLRKAGLKVPENMAVIGFDDIPVAQVFEPALTTMAQPMQALGAAAVEMLLSQFRAEKPASRTLPHTLTLRETA